MRKRIKRAVTEYRIVDVSSFSGRGYRRRSEHGGVSHYRPFTGNVSTVVDFWSSQITDDTTASQIRKFLGTYRLNGFGREYFFYNLFDIMGGDPSDWPVMDMTKFARELMSEYNALSNLKKTKPFSSVNYFIEKIWQTKHLEQ